MLRDDFMIGAKWPFGYLLPLHYAAILADPPCHFRTNTPLNNDPHLGQKRWLVTEDYDDPVDRKSRKGLSVNPARRPG